MSKLVTQLNPRSAEFQANAAAMRTVVEDLRAQLAQVAQGGGEAARAKHVARGKLLPRERVQMLLDPGTPFLELAPLAALNMYNNDAPGAGLIAGIGRVAGVEYGRKGVRINTVLPGQLHTPLVDAFLAGQQTEGDVEALLARRRRRIPLPLSGDGRDTANAVLFLASDEARFITGTELVVDGGMSARCD